MYVSFILCTYAENRGTEESVGKAEKVKKHYLSF